MNDIPAFDDAEIPHAFTETSEFCIVPAEWRVEYIKKNSASITSILTAVKLDFKIKNDTTLWVSTNTKTRDPFIILKGRDFLQLISRGMDIEIARDILRDDRTCEIINIHALSNKSSREVFENRRRRLQGPGDQTIKALELLTKTKILVSGKTVSVIGPYKGVLEVSNIVERAFKNLHPVYLIKELIAKRGLESRQDMQNVDWKRYLPPVKTKTKNVRGLRKTIERKERDSTALPDVNPRRKIDLEFEKSAGQRSEEKITILKDEVDEYSSECDSESDTIIKKFLDDCTHEKLQD